MNTEPTLRMLLKSFRLPAFATHYEELARKAETETCTYERYLHSLAQLEAYERRHRKIQLLLKQSRLPREKTLATFEQDRLPKKVRALLPTLCEGSFLARAEAVLAFGNPGSGKTHLLCGLAHELIQRGHSVLFSSAALLVQRLLQAKRDLRLSQELKRLDKFEALLIDDIGYVQQDREEMEVLFTLLAERYERRSVMITTNLVFSKWDQIFKDPMTTAAAVDRLVHHAVILELNLPSYRAEKALEKARRGNLANASEEAPIETAGQDAGAEQRKGAGDVE
jgi:DNA replication protein DnaC